MIFVRLGEEYTVKTFLVVNAQTIYIDIILSFGNADVDLIFHVGVKNFFDNAGSPQIVTVKD